MTRPRVMIADDHAPTRAAVTAALEAGGFDVCGEAATAPAAVAVAASTSPDVCLLDINMPGRGTRAVAEISERVPTAAIVMLTVSRDDADLFHAVRAGAKGYLLKGTNLTRLPDALRRVLAGEAVIDGSLAARLLVEFRRQAERPLPHGAELLSEREWEVLNLLRDGRSTAEIADQLFVAPVTVRSHVAAILRKFQVASRREVLRMLDGDTELPR